MAGYDYDFFVIGAGSGGVRAGRVAAQLGARVAVAESGALGGTCVNVGCVPKKLLVYASQFARDFEDAAGYGWDVGECSFDWARLIERKNVEIARLNEAYGRVLDGSGAELIHGRAELIDSHTLEVAGRRVSAAHILVATGSRPFVPQQMGSEHVITSDEVFFLETQPERVLIVGGGYIAVEFAGIFNAMGSRVTLSYRGDQVLRGFDADIRSHLTLELEKSGIEMRLGTNPVDLERQGDLRVMQLDDGSSVEADQVLFATGRWPNSRGIGLEQVGVKLSDHGAIIVDEFGTSSVPHIHAVGDVTDRINLTPVAIAEGQALAECLFGHRKQPADHENVPSAVFSQPPVATVGLTEVQARQRFERVDVYRSSFKPMKNTLSGRDERSMMKLVVCADTDVVLGCHVVGPEAGEIVQGFAVALKCGATKTQLDSTIGIHPTAAEEMVTLRNKVSQAD